MISARTINYAVPPEGHFWKWSTGQDSIEWDDGSTLALWPEVRAVLEFAGENGGLPPFGAILLILAACRDEEGSGIAKVIPVLSRVAPPASLHLEGRHNEMMSTALNGLRGIQQLSASRRSSLAAKCEILQAVFEKGSYRISPDHSDTILAELNTSLHGVDDRPRYTAAERLELDVRSLADGFSRMKSGALDLRLATGLDSEIREDLTPPPLPSEITDPRLLLDHLISSGGESGAAAAVAKRAIAMMNFPGRFGAPLDLPVGGIADITNRGTVDRLLPGELAWDDLVLAARLVHNEALYFRREIPPQHVAVSHTVLLDRGLRLWGTARVFSLGVALGLWHHPKLNGPGETFECVAAERDGFGYLDLATPAGVRAALEVLVPAATPDVFLTAWWDAARIVDDAAIPDVSFVTVKEHLEDASTRRLLGEIAGWIHERAGRFRVIAIDRLGDLEVQAWSPGGNHTLFRGDIDLDEILKPPVAETPPKTSGPPPLRAQPDPLQALLPIYAEERLPFLFPVVPQISAYREIPWNNKFPEGGIGVSLDHRLMQWPKPGWAALELIPGILPGREHWIGYDGFNLTLIASAEKVGGSVRIFKVGDDRRLEEIEIEPSRHAFPRHATVKSGTAVLVYADKAEAFSLKSGRRLVEHPIAKLPASPVVNFDGETIEVYDSGQKPGHGPGGWGARDGTFPLILTPDHVSIEQGILRVMCGQTVYQFNPFKMTWDEKKAGPARFTAFVDSPQSPANGVTLQTAKSGHLEVWYDSRGLLHLRKDFDDPKQTWSILLSTPAASVWSPLQGIHSLDRRLLVPTEQEQPHPPVSLLEGFLRSACTIRL